MSTGQRRAVRERDAVALLLGALLAVVAWGFLVLTAVHLGRSARDGDGSGDWVLAAVVTVAATGCLLLVLTLVPRARAVWHGDRPRRTPGRRAKGR